MARNTGVDTVGTAAAAADDDDTPPTVAVAAWDDDRTHGTGGTRAAYADRLGIGGSVGGDTTLAAGAVVVDAIPLDVATGAGAEVATVGAAVAVVGAGTEETVEDGGGTGATGRLGAVEVAAADADTVTWVAAAEELSAGAGAAVVTAAAAAAVCLAAVVAAAAAAAAAARAGAAASNAATVRAIASRQPGWVALVATTAFDSVLTYASTVPSSMPHVNSGSSAETGISSRDAA